MTDSTSSQCWVEGQGGNQGLGERLPKRELSLPSAKSIPSSSSLEDLVEEGNVVSSLEQHALSYSALTRIHSMEVIGPIYR